MVLKSVRGLGSKLFVPGLSQAVGVRQSDQHPT